MQTSSTSKLPRLGWLSQVDDLLFAFERTIVATFLMAITTMIFLDVVFRRLITQETKLGDLLTRLFEVQAPETIAILHSQVAPLAYGVIGFLLLWFCTASAQRELGRPLFGIRTAGPLIVAGGIFAAICMVLWMMLHVTSRFVYIALALAGALGYGRMLVQSKPPKHVAQLLVLGVAMPAFVWFAWLYFPEGYAWSKEMSLMLLMWVGFFGASICVHEGKHLFVEAVVAKLPEKLARLAIAGGFLIASAFCMLMALLGYRYTFDPEVGALHLGGVLELTRLPDWISALPLPLAFAAASLRFLAGSLSQFSGGSYGQPSQAEGMAEAEKLAQEGTAA